MMELRWELNEYGYELLEEYSDSQIALLKHCNKEEYYISCIDNQEVNEWLETNDLEEAKKMTIERVVDDRKDQIEQLEVQIRSLLELSKRKD
jgi:hypothetical protein